MAGEKYFLVNYVTHDAPKPFSSRMKGICELIASQGVYTVTKRTSAWNLGSDVLTRDYFTLTEDCSYIADYHIRDQIERPSRGRYSRHTQTHKLVGGISSIVRNIYQGTGYDGVSIPLQLVLRMYKVPNITICYRSTDLPHQHITLVRAGALPM